LPDRTTVLFWISRGGDFTLAVCLKGVVRRDGSTSSGKYCEKWLSSLKVEVIMDEISPLPFLLSKEISDIVPDDSSTESTVVFLFNHVELVDTLFA